MPVSDNFKLLNIEKELLGSSSGIDSAQIDVNNLVNLETNYDANRNDTSSEKSSRVSDLDCELNASTAQSELGVGKHLKSSVNCAKYEFSQGQCHEMTSKINQCDDQDSFPVTCQRTTEVFLKQTASEAKPSCSRPFKSCGSSAAEFAKLPMQELRAIAEDLAQTVEEVSSELVSLLLENDALQQESDARNIAIEQLLKLTWKQTENELRPVQMSVILPSDASDNNVD